jgi:GrpB-like predicted nucleotidyltransferase (UPF0157 family)
MISDPIFICEYDPRWPLEFARLRERVIEAVGDIVVRVEHVGSTAVPGLAAKPVIDLDVVIRSTSDFAFAVERLARLGYDHEGDLGVAEREAFAHPAGEARHHLYVCVEGAEPLRRHLRFRDRLRGDPALAAAYADLKRHLAERFRDDRDAYTEGKTSFIEAALADTTDAPSA